MKEEWQLENERQHEAIMTEVRKVNDRVNQALNITPLLIRWVCFPLVAILGGAYGVGEIIKRVSGG